MADDRVELMLDEEAAVAAGRVDGEQFPEHFPIDDLLSSDETVDDPWVTLEGEASDHDRFAAAQAFQDPGGEPVAGSPFSNPTYADGGFSDPPVVAVDPGTPGDTPSSVAAFTAAAFSADTFAPDTLAPDTLAPPT